MIFAVGRSSVKLTKGNLSAQDSVLLLQDLWGNQAAPRAQFQFRLLLAASPLTLPPSKIDVCEFDNRYYTQDGVVSYLPRYKGATISFVNNRSWQVRMSARAEPPRSHSVSYSEEYDLKSHVRALVRCLRWAWDVFKNELGGHPCPYVLWEL